MSKNVAQVFAANPITTIGNPDLIYVGQNAAIDAAINGLNFKAQFSPLSTKGDLYTFTTQNARLAVGSINGQILQVNAGTATGLAWSTATYPNTTTINQILYSSANNTISGLATANNASLSTNATGVPTWLALGAGQVVIGSAIGAPLAATLSAGTGVTITNGNNSITISSSGANPWVDQTSGSVTLAVNTGYTTDNGAALVTYTLPVTAAIGDWVEINGSSAGGWAIAQGVGQQIHIGSVASTIGVGGSISSTNQYDCIRLRCVVANTTFVSVSTQGNITVV